MNMKTDCIQYPSNHKHCKLAKNICHPYCAKYRKLNEQREHEFTAALNGLHHL